MSLVRVLRFLRKMEKDDAEIDKLFEKSRETLKLISKSKLIPDDWLDMSIENRLYTYAYYKQATKGPCLIGQPEWWNSAGRYKWSAWKKLEDLPVKDAKIGYIQTTMLILIPLKRLNYKQMQQGLSKYTSKEQRLELQTLVETLLSTYQQL